MLIIESLKMAVSTLGANKVRSGLTMLGIIIGNASVVAMIGIGQGAQTLANDQFANLGPNTIFVVPGSRQARNTTVNFPKTLVLADALAIAEQVPTVAEVAPEINARFLISYRNRNMTALVTGSTPEYASVRNFTLEKGRLINNIDLVRNKRVTVIGTEVAAQLFPTQNPLGQQLRIKNLSFEVIGILEAKGSFFGNNQDEMLIIPLSTMNSQLVGKTGPYGVELSWISLTARSGEEIRAAKFQIENLLRLRHKIVAEDDFRVETAKQMIEIFGTITKGLTLLLALIAGISLIVGGIGVMNIMLVSVSERTGEIGLRKAIGAREQDILLQFLIESTLVSIAGGALGILVGAGAIVLVSSFSPLAATVSATAVALSLSVSTGIGLFFGVFPAYRASKLEPIVALRSV
ncbi:ABC transporter permease [Microcystis aeruginosa CS-563/04]|uniref:ABC transporter permease n=1 Tax=Microcystis aeruginosa TaxID=1126 RepID=UPI00232C04CA|nr:ABC transporter permease [Microcystis aeruginosa]MDB9421073.1 ABC transporter permease [Microcystis aeruginosa CS-563/04]